MWIASHLDLTDLILELQLIMEPFWVCPYCLLYSNWSGSCTVPAASLMTGTSYRLMGFVFIIQLAFWDVLCRHFVVADFLQPYDCHLSVGFQGVCSCPGHLHVDFRWFNPFGCDHLAFFGYHSALIQSKWCSNILAESPGEVDEWNDALLISGQQLPCTRGDWRLFHVELASIMCSHSVRSFWVKWLRCDTDLCVCGYRCLVWSGVSVSSGLFSLAIHPYSDGGNDVTSPDLPPESTLAYCQLLILESVLSLKFCF